MYYYNYIIFDSEFILYTHSLGPHCAYFRMRKLKSPVAKVSTLRVEKTFSTRKMDTFATCDFNFRLRKYAQCGPRLNDAHRPTNPNLVLYLQFLL